MNYDLLESLGVDVAINNATTPFQSIARDVDVVLDTVGGDTLKPGSILVSTLQAPSEATTAIHGVRQAMIYSAPPTGPTLKTVAEMVDAGQLKTVVSNVLPLQDVQHAHQIIEGHHARDKIVLRVV